MPGSDYVVCLRNTGYEATLDRGARYRLLPDAEAARHGQVRIVDESGEDYLYPESWFSGIGEVTVQGDVDAAAGRSQRSTQGDFR